jgi:hypothetical protein
LILWDAKVRYGRERAAASVLDVDEEDADEGGFVVVGDAGTAWLPTAPDTFCDPFFGVC